MSTRSFPLLAALLAALALATTAQAAEYVPSEVVVGHEDGSVTTVGTEAGQSVPEAARELRDDPGVAYAVPNYVAHASQFTPDDPRLRRQWNFTGAYGIGMPEAWSLAAAAGAPGGRGAIVAVLDSGVANERYGHGTHVTGTIAEATNNWIAVAGLAYGVKVIPRKELNDFGEGDSLVI